MKVGGVVLLGVLLIGLCGCGDGGDSSGGQADAAIDYAAWKAELEEANGRPGRNFVETREIIEEICETSEDEFGEIVANDVGDAGHGGEIYFRISISYACPERVDEIDAVAP